MSIPAETPAQRASEATGRVLLATSKLDIVETGHFVCEEAAETYAALATSWWEGGYADV